MDYVSVFKRAFSIGRPGSRSGSLIAMMRPADLREGNDIARGRRMYRTGLWAILHQITEASSTGEAGTMAAQEGLRPGDRDCREDQRERARLLDHEQAIAVRELDANWHRPPQHGQLMPECGILRFNSTLRLEGARRTASGRSKTARPSLLYNRRSCHLINTHEFSVHTRIPV